MILANKVGAAGLSINRRPAAPRVKIVAGFTGREPHFNAMNSFQHDAHGVLLSTDPMHCAQAYHRCSSERRNLHQLPSCPTGESGESGLGSFRVEPSL